MTTPAGGSTFNSLDSAFKQRVLNRPIADLCYKDKPLWGLLPKMTDLSGANQSTRALHVPLLYARPPAISGTLSVAQARAGGSSSAVQAWELTTTQIFGAVQIDNESIERSKGKEGAFVDIKMLEIDQMHEALSNYLHVMSYGDGSGVLAQVGNSTQQSTFATSVCTLLNAEDAVHLEVGYELTGASTATGSERALGSNSHGLYIISVDADAGTFTVGTAAGVACNLSDSADGIPNLGNSDYLTLRGTRGAAITGFQGFIPATAPTSGTLFNVSQFKSPTRLAGSRFDGSSFGVEEAILRGVNRTGRNNGTVKQVFINYKHFADLAMSVVARGVAQLVEVGPEETPSIGYEAVRIVGPRGAVDVIPDHACPSTLAAGMDVEKWMVASVNEPIHILGGDGFEVLRLSSTDGVECRVGGYLNMCPLSPVDNCNIKLPA